MAKRPIASPAKGGGYRRKPPPKLGRYSNTPPKEPKLPDADEGRRSMKMPDLASVEGAKAPPEMATQGAPQVMSKQTAPQAPVPPRRRR